MCACLFGSVCIYTKTEAEGQTWVTCSRTVPVALDTGYFVDLVFCD